jgi:hypothetical protein
VFWTKYQKNTIKAAKKHWITLFYTTPIYFYFSGWLRGLPAKGLLSYDRERNPPMTNYAQLGEKLLTLDHRELGDDATCACVSEEVEEQAIPVAACLEGANTDQGSSHENMDNVEVAALTPGADPLVTRFSKSANPKNPKAMLDQDLLSSRLQGNAVKEALAITLLRKFRRNSPINRQPAWMPKELLSISEEV